MMRLPPLRSWTALPLMITAVALLGGCAQIDPTAGSVAQKRSSFRHGPPAGPAPWNYFITSYGGPTDPGDNGLPACGGRHADGTWYYATGAWSFGCGAKLKIEGNGKCVVVKVVDNGPAAWVERKAKQRCGGTGYIIDTSPLATKYLFGTKSAGWSDCYAIKVTKIDKSTPSGPCSSTPPANTTPPVTSAPAAKWIGHGCQKDSDCLTGTCLKAQSGFPQGMCSQACERFCPDRRGETMTFCVADPMLGGACTSRCNWNDFPTSGCRAGYRCRKVARHHQSSVRRNACVPEGKADAIGAPPDAEGEQLNPEVDADQLAGCAVSSARDSAPGALWLLLFGLAFSARRRAKMAPPR